MIPENRSEMLEAILIKELGNNMGIQSGHDL